MNQHSKASRSIRARFEYFLYLVAELERTIERDAARWDSESAEAAQQRLDGLMATLRRLVSQITGD